MDYGRRPYIDNKSSYQESMEKYPDKVYRDTLDSKMHEKQPYSEFKKPYISDDYQDMEYQEPPAIYEMKFDPFKPPSDPFQLPSDQPWEIPDPYPYYDWEEKGEWQWVRCLSDVYWVSWDITHGIWQNGRWECESDPIQSFYLEVTGKWFRGFRPTIMKLEFEYDDDYGCTPEFALTLGSRIAYNANYSSNSNLICTFLSKDITSLSFDGTATVGDWSVTNWHITDIQFYAKI